MGFYDFGNNRNDGYTAKSYEYTPGWEKDVERNPDKLRSSAGMWIEDHNGDLMWVLQVKGAHGEKLGAMVLRASSSYKNSDGKLEFMGVSEFTAAEIHTGTIDESEMGKIGVLPCRE